MYISFTFWRLSWQFGVSKELLYPPLSYFLSGICPKTKKTPMKHCPDTGYTARGLTLSNHQTEPYNKLHNFESTTWNDLISRWFKPCPFYPQTLEVTKNLQNGHLNHLTTPKRQTKNCQDLMFCLFLNLPVQTLCLLKKPSKNKGRSQTKNRWCHYGSSNTKLWDKMVVSTCPSPTTAHSGFAIITWNKPNK